MAVSRSLQGVPRAKQKTLRPSLIIQFNMNFKSSKPQTNEPYLGNRLVQAGCVHALDGPAAAAPANESILPNTKSQVALRFFCGPIVSRVPAESSANSTSSHSVHRAIWCTTSDPCQSIVLIHSFSFHHTFALVFTHTRASFSAA